MKRTYQNKFIQSNYCMSKPLLNDMQFPNFQEQLSPVSLITLPA